VTAASVKTFSNLDLPPVPMEAIIAGQAADAAAAVVATPPDEKEPPVSLGGEVALTGQTPQAPNRATPAAANQPASTGPGAVAAPAPAVGATPTAARGDEKQWRDRVTTARQTLERDQLLMAAMDSRINSLNTDIINRDDPAQQAELRRQLQMAVAERARLQSQVDADQKAIEAIRLEARRLGVPPGWVR
jgi:hypothetical protein